MEPFVFLMALNYRNGEKWEDGGAKWEHAESGPLQTGDRDVSPHQSQILVNKITFRVRKYHFLSLQCV